jgi:hypothetical protein
MSAGVSHAARNPDRTRWLALLRERIAVLYSGDAALRVDAAHGNTTVTLDLPARGAPTGSIQ